MARNLAPADDSSNGSAANEGFSIDYVTNETAFARARIGSKA
ncbi:hypothetical protein AHiyo4_26930 [Arthrobacter sp. Hiyo4]|nr:hypothetical protein AHiyo4_26930 [Arthrobacter sp. Hiyo4]